MLSTYEVSEAPLTVTGPMNSNVFPLLESRIVCVAQVGAQNPMLTASDSTVTLAEADFEESAVLVADTVRVSEADKDVGAANWPEGEMVPVRELPPSTPFTLQVTEPDRPFTRAVNDMSPAV